MENNQKFNNLQDLLETVKETFNTETYQMTPYAGRYRKERRFNVCVDESTRVLVETQPDGSLIVLNIIEPFEVSATYEGSSRDLVDIELTSGRIISEVPFYNRKGEVISYDEAIALYGFDGLSQGIWDDENYLNFIKNNI